MIALDIIESSVNEKIQGSPSGICCVFVPITDKIGAKTYKNEEDRDGCYDRQNQAAAVDLGPETYGKFEMVAESEYSSFSRSHKIGDKLYGYLTEIVETNSSYCRVEAEKLVRELRDKINFDFYDIGYNNVGRKNGKLVCIDFGYD
jgi:hypothetical protein